MSSDKQNDLTFPALPFKDKVYRFVLNMVSDSMDAEDIMQDLLVKIWRRKEQYQEIENKEAWCMTVAKNLAIDKIRARKAPTSDVSEHYNLSDKSATPDQAYEQEDEIVGRTSGKTKNDHPSAGCRRLYLSGNRRYDRKYPGFCQSQFAQSPKSIKR